MVYAWALILLGALILVTVIIALVVLFTRRRVRATPKTRGTKPGRGDQLIDVSVGGGSPGGGHGSVIRVTRDPQLYTKAMMPKSKKGKSK